MTLLVGAAKDDAACGFVQGWQRRGDDESDEDNINGIIQILLAIRAKSSQSIIDILVKNKADITLENTRGETAESLFKQNILMQSEY